MSRFTSRFKGVASELSSRAETPASGTRAETPSESISGGPSGTAAFTATIKAFRDSFADLRVDLSSKCLAALDPSGKNVLPLTKALGPVFDAFGRSALQLAETLSDADIEAHRKALKAEQTMAKMKMEASRTAAAVAAKNKEAEMEATFNSALASKLESLSGGSIQALKEAQEEIVELKEKLNKASNRANTAEEMCKTLRGMLTVKETECKEMQTDMLELREELEEAKMGTKGSFVAEANAKLLRESLLEAAAAAERATLQADPECKRLTRALAERLRKEMQAQAEGKREAFDERLQRLLNELETMCRTLADVEHEKQDLKREMNSRMTQTMEENERLQEELEALQSELGYDPKNPSRGSSRGAGGIRGELERAQADALAARAELSSARERLHENETMIMRQEVELDAARRMYTEQISRVAAEAERAALQREDECKRQVEAMASRLRMELEKVKQKERESNQQQLNRLLEEISDMSNQLGQAEAKLTAAEEYRANAEQLMKRVKVLERQETLIRDALVQAMLELQGKPGGNMPLNELLTRTLGHYRHLKGESTVVGATIDKALTELNAPPAGPNEHLIDKLHQLLDEQKNSRKDSQNLRATLEKAFSDLAITVGENANLSDKIRQLLLEYRRATEIEQQLHTTIKRQHANLSLAATRIKEAELDLKRSVVAGVEQREALVTAALNGLSQLRGRLGYQNAVRSGATKPVEEALVVKEAITVDRRLIGSASSPGLREMVMPFTPAPATKANPRFEAFMERVTETVNNPWGGGMGESPTGTSPTDKTSPGTRSFPPVSPYWSQASSMPVADHNVGRYRELSPVSMPRVPRPGTTKRQTGVDFLLPASPGKPPPTAPPTGNRFAAPMLTSPPRAE